MAQKEAPQPSRRRLLGFLAFGGLGVLGGSAGTAWLLSGASGTSAAGEDGKRTQSGGGRAPLPDRAGAAPAPDLRPSQDVGEVRFPPPSDFRPEVPGGMQNVLLEKAGQGVWFHPMTNLRFLGDQEHVWSYQYYFGWKSTGQDKLTLVQHGGEEGRLVFRQEKGPSTLVLGVGTLDSFIDNAGVKKDLKGDIRRGFKADVVPSVWIRAHPFVDVEIFDADTGLPVTKDGKPVKGITSESGDIGFGLDEKGRWVFVITNPVDPKLEIFVWKGPHDRVQEDVNWIDLRGKATNGAGSIK